MVGYNKEHHVSDQLSSLHRTRRSIKDLLASLMISVRVANLAKAVSCSTAGWASPTTPHIGTYQKIVEAILTEIRARLVEKEATSPPAHLSQEGYQGGLRPGAKRPAAYGSHQEAHKRKKVAEPADPRGQRGRGRWIGGRGCGGRGGYRRY